MSADGKRTERFSKVPDFIFEDQDLTPEARLVAAWLAGRQETFEIRVEPMLQKFLGLSERVWQKNVKPQLEKKGWWRSTRVKLADGKYHWSHQFSERGLPTEFVEPPTPNSRRDAESKNAFGSPAMPMSSESPDNHAEVDQAENTSPPKPTIDEIVEAAVWMKNKSGDSINNLQAYRAAIRRRLTAEGATSEDQNIVSIFRSETDAANRRETTLQALKAHPRFEIIPIGEELTTAWNAFLKHACQDVFESSSSYLEAQESEKRRFKIFLTTRWPSIKSTDR